MENDTKTEETIAVSKDALRTLINEETAKAYDKAKQEFTNTFVTPEVKQAFGFNTTSDIKFKFVANERSRIGTIMQAAGKAQLEKTSIDKAFIGLGLEMSNYVNPELKSMTMGNAESGGLLVNEAFATDIIPMLENSTIIRKAGCPTVQLPAGNMTFPIGATGSTGYYRGETEKKKSSGQTFENVNIAVKSLVVQVPISNKLLRYSSYNLDQYITNEMLTRIQLMEDNTYFNGIGTQNTPKGLSKWVADANKFTMTGGATAVTRKTDLLKLFKAPAKANVSKIKPIIVMSDTTYWGLADQTDANSNTMDYAKTLLEQQRLYGVPVFTTNAISQQIFYVDLAYCLIGMGMDLKMTFIENGSYMAADGTIVNGQVTGESVYEIEMDHDFIVKQPLAVSLLSGVTWGE